jgi:hypothetical protein
LEVKGLNDTREQLRNGGAVIYSLIVMATIIPGFPSVSNLIVIPYYILVPGYFVTTLVRNTGVLERLFYSIAWSVAILASVYSLKSIGIIQHLPAELIIPSLTIVLLAYDSFHR